MKGDLLIQTNGLTKKYGRRRAVDGIDLRVPEGVVAGFVGPNGAGKTTTLRILLGLVRPSGGEGSVLGVPLARPAEYLRHVGALVEGPAFYPALTGYENLEIQAVLGEHDSATIRPLFDFVNLTERAKDRYRTYSLGMRQRLGIAAALLGEPQIVLLDEPANGLDPDGIRQMRQLLKALRKSGRTVLISSHLLSEVQQVCDWIIVIDQGRVVFQGTTVELLSSRKEYAVVHCLEQQDAVQLSNVLVSYSLTATISGQDLIVPTAEISSQLGKDGESASLSELCRVVVESGIRFTGIGYERTKLEDRYDALTRGGRSENH